MCALHVVATVPGSADWTTVLEACRAAEAGGFDGFARPDHLLAEGVMAPAGSPVLECFTTLAALATATTRLRLVQTVACNAFRSPGLLAKMVATLDVISGGRVELGLGAGWLAAEFEAYGYDFPPAAIRLAQLREALQVVKLLWTGEPVDYDGRYYHLKSALCAPHPVQHPRPPIMVGGGGPGLLAVAADEADGVNLVPSTGPAAADPRQVQHFTLTRFQRRAVRVRKLAEAAGRDPSTVTLSALMFVQIADDDADAARRLAAVASRHGISPAEAEQLVLPLVGTPRQLRERLAERIALLDLGAVVIHLPSPEALTHFAAEVLPAVRA